MDFSLCLLSRIAFSLLLLGVPSKSLSPLVSVDMLFWEMTSQHHFRTFSQSKSTALQSLRLPGGRTLIIQLSQSVIVLSSQFHSSVKPSLSATESPSPPRNRACSSVSQSQLHCSCCAPSRRPYSHRTLSYSRRSQSLYCPRSSTPP